MFEFVELTSALTSIGHGQQLDSRHFGIRLCHSQQSNSRKFFTVWNFKICHFIHKLVQAIYSTV